MLTWTPISPSTRSCAGCVRPAKWCASVFHAASRMGQVPSLPGRFRLCREIAIMRTHTTPARSVSCFLAAIAGMMLLASPPADAQPKPQEQAIDDRASGIPAADLYRAQTIVTGQGEANRIVGFASCLEDVLVKVSGQLRLAGDPRVDAYKADAAKLVRGFSYRDEKGGKPKNDEQGTRDRSFV